MSDFLRHFESVLRHLDPSLFQNVIIGILAIFIPFAIVFFSGIVGSKNRRSEFEKTVLSKEVFEVKSLFVVSAVGIAVLSFFTTDPENELPLLAKVFAILFAGLLVVYFARLFWKVLRFSEGHGAEFEIRFLKGLQLSKPLPYQQNNNWHIKEDILKSWQCLWQEEMEKDERNLTEVFVSHIDNAIDCKEFDFAVRLSQSYQNGLEKRDIFCLSSQILPKVFEWTKTLRRLEPQSQKETEKVKVMGCTNHFQGSLFRKIAQRCLLNHVDSYSLFKQFNEHVKHAQKEIESEELNKTWNNVYADERHVEGLFSDFLAELFGGMEDTGRNFDIWKLCFPDDWKIKTADDPSSKWFRRIVKDCFEQMFINDLFSDVHQEKENRVVSYIVSLLFPSVDPRLFSIFLSLRSLRSFPEDIRKVIKLYPTFNMKPDVIPSLIRDDRGNEQIFGNNGGKTREEETVDVIFDFFDIFGGAGVRRLNLQKTLSQLESPEIEEFCRPNEDYVERREQLIELIQLLLGRVKQEEISSS